MYIGKSIEWLCMEDCHSAVKLSRSLAWTVLVLNGSLFRNLTLVSYWASWSALFTDIFSSALSGSSWADTPSYRNVLKPKKVLTKNLKSVGMTLAKVKEQDGMTLAKVRHTQVSHALHWSAKYPTSAAYHNLPDACTCIIWNLRGYTTFHGQSPRKLKLARAEPSKLTTSSGKALETHN